MRGPKTAYFGWFYGPALVIFTLFGLTDLTHRYNKGLQRFHKMFNKRVCYFCQGLLF